uniref:Thioredoxin domain-containing protein n=1 Tax=Eptatretus burgeri TaxID=7764 RepID=A0A8C4WYP7_EPTBU
MHCLRQIKHLRSRAQRNVRSNLSHQFYAPWCHLCQELHPLWEEVERELSDWAKEEPGKNAMRKEITVINIGKMDAIRFSSLASDFGSWLSDNQTVSVATESCSGTTHELQ